MAVANRGVPRGNRGVSAFSPSIFPAADGFYRAGASLRHRRSTVRTWLPIWRPRRKDKMPR
jgi:hypothetical protein